MPQQKIQHLISELRDVFGGEEASAEQVRVLRELEAHIHSGAGAGRPDPTLVETVELLAQEVESAHPLAAKVLKQIIDALKNMGV